MELGGTGSIEGDPYAGYVVDDSDLEYSECSEDDSSGEEFGFTKDQKGQAQNKINGPAEEDADSDGGEFEREMDNEANRLLQMVTGGKMIPGVTAGSGGPKMSLGPKNYKGLEDPSMGSEGQGMENRGEGDSGEKQKVKGDKAEGQFYDDIYFDSSDEDLGEGSGGREVKADGSHTKVRKLTNEELFYDPNMDAEDEKWVERQRMAYHNVHTSAELTKESKGQIKPSSSGGGNSSSSVSENPSYPNSDAVLNCPACMSTLCLDCQRHETYPNQYRAMFVLNCKIIKDEVLTYHPKQKQNKKQKRKRHRAQAEKGKEEEEDELYRPVQCTVCDTEVAVYDREEIFHFFNVIAGAP